VPLDTSRMVFKGHLTSPDIKQYADLLTGSMTDQPVTLGNTLSIGGSLSALKIATPASPPAGYMKLYPKADNKFYKLDSAGVEEELGTGGGEMAADTEEFLPANAATTVVLSRLPTDVLLVTRDGLAQSTTSGHYTVAGSTLTFTDAFNGSEQVLVTYVVGEIGATGPQGPPGPQGPQGATGAQGPMGSIAPWSVATSHLTVTPDTTYDIGASGATRPRDLHLGRNLVLPTAGRILGDFSNATQASRVMFQSSTANATTSVGAIPSGTSRFAQFVAYNSLDATNSARLRMAADETVMTFASDAIGTGVLLPLSIQTGNAERLRIATDGTWTMDAARIRNVHLAADTARANLLTNGGFRIAQRTGWASPGFNAYGPDRWQFLPNGSSTFTSCSIVNNSAAGGNACSLNGIFTFSAGDGIVQQLIRITDGAQQNLRNRRISFSLYVFSTGASTRAFVSTDGTGGGYSYSSLVGTNTWVRAVVQDILVPADATYITVGIYMQATTTFYMSEAMLVQGSVAADYVPLHPADDLARCQRYYEIVGGGTSLIFSGYASAASQTFYFSTTYKVVKAVMPTVTKLGNWTGVSVNATTANCDAIDLSMCRWAVVPTGAGPFYVNPQPTGFAVEANP
jgi:hypothetical protein